MSDVKKEPSASPNVSSTTSIKIPAASVNRFKTTTATMKSNHKSSVSILPVNSADVSPIPTVKKQSGIEIIPLDDIGPDSNLDPASKSRCPCYKQGSLTEGEGSVDLFIRVARFVRKVNKIFNIESSSSILVSTRRSTLLSLPFQ
jgi:hypothetical protein